MSTGNLTADELLGMIRTQLDILQESEDAITALYACYSKLVDLEMELEDDE